MSPIVGCILGQRGSGLHFLGTLLQAHKSSKWKTIPMCCYLPHYFDVVQHHMKDIAFHFDHAEQPDINKTRFPTIKITVNDDNLLWRIKKTKKNFKSINFIDHMGIENIDSIEGSDYPRYDIELDYFNPHKSYEEICEVFDIQRDYDFFLECYINYYKYQYIVVRDTKFLSIQDTLKKELHGIN